MWWRGERSLVSLGGEQPGLGQGVGKKRWARKHDTILFYSKKPEGFNLGIDPSLLAHPANCKLMVHNDNISKNKKSSLTIIELNDRINEWDIKYNNLGIL